MIALAQTIPPPPGPQPAAASPAGWLGIAGAATALVGSFLPWISVATVSGTIDVAGTNGDGRVTLVIAAIAGVCLIIGVTHPQEVAARVAAVVGACGVAISVLEYANPLNQLDAVASTGASARVAFGLYLCIVGFVVVTAGAFLTRPQISPTVDQVVRPLADGSS